MSMKIGPEFSENSEIKVMSDMVGRNMLQIASTCIGWRYRDEITQQGKGPALIQIPRVGKDGNEFMMWKWRTLDGVDHSQVPVLHPGDPRITAVGSRLRNSSQDEVAQWQNIDQDMHFIGCRPLARRTHEMFKSIGTVAIYEDWAGLRELVKPGCFGFNAARGRNAEGLPPDARINPNTYTPPLEEVDKYMLVDIGQIEGESPKQEMQLWGLLTQVALGRISNF